MLLCAFAFSWLTFQVMNNFLLFLSRVALICNGFFLLAASLQWKDYIGNSMLVSTIVITGYFLAVFLFSPLVNIMYALRATRRKDLFIHVPRWLVFTNFIFLLLQVIFIVFFLNGIVDY